MLRFTLYYQFLLVLAVCALSPRLSHAQVSYASSQSAHNAAESAQPRITEYQRCIAHALERNKALNVERATVYSGLIQTTAAKKKALAELLSGQFCSKCECSASEIERTTHRPFSEHLEDVNANAESASQELFERKRREFNQRIDSLRKQLQRLESDQARLRINVARCHDGLNKARLEYYTALSFERYLAAKERWQKRGASPEFSDALKDLEATRFGLMGKEPTSDYNALRAYWGSNKAQTLPASGYPANVESVTELKNHLGIDFSSKDANGIVRSLPFTAGVRGKATYIAQGGFNTIDVELDNGSHLQFLHASEVAEPLLIAARNHRYVLVEPESYLGMTGGKGPAGVNQYATHLHVQARDAQGKPIDPRIAVLQLGDISPIIYNAARRKASREITPRPTLDTTPLAPIDSTEPDYTPKRRKSKPDPIDIELGPPVN